MIARDKERSFGTLLREYRLAKRISQEELAERARLSAKTIGALERGERQSPYRDTVELLARALDLAADEQRDLESSARRRRAPSLRGITNEPAPGRVRHNLPLETTRLIGRDRARAAVAELLRASRVVTLVGTGGIGKTRLATAVAAATLERFPDGTWLVELAPLHTAEEIASAVAAAAGIRVAASGSARDTLLAGLRERHLLLVLDNCEHVLDAVAPLSTEIVTSCAGVTILATSREALRVRGERILRVEPLTLPLDASVESLERSESVALFRERASAVLDGFAGRPSDAGALTAICRRLDGIPLAIELAAARVGSFSLAGLARALDNRFALLTGGERGAALRHQAMRSTIAWSCDLLNARDRTLFRRCGIFVDGFSLDAAVDVCSDAVLSEAAIFESIASLVDKSLIIAEIGETVTRYRLFESTLAFARELLVEADERATFAHRHATFMRAFVNANAWEMWESPTPATVATIALELENLRAALRYTLDDGNDPELGAALAVESAAIFRRLDRRVELQARLDAILEAPSTRVPPHVEAAANYELLYSMVAKPQRQLEAGRIAVARLGDLQQPARQAYAAALLAQNLAVCFGRYSDARPHIDAALRFARAGSDLALLDQVLRIASQALPLEALAERRRAGAESLALARASGVERRIADALITAAEVEFAAHAFPAALALGVEALQVQRHINNQTGLGLLLTNVAAYALAAGDLPAAQSYAREALRLARQTANEHAGLLAIQHLAGVALARDRTAVERAACWLGFVNARMQAAGLLRETTEQIGYDRDIATINTQLGPHRTADALALGALYTEERVLDEIHR